MVMLKMNKKNSPACFHTGESFLICLNYSAPHSQNRIFDAYLLLMWLLISVHVRKRRRQPGSQLLFWIPG